MLVAKSRTDYCKASIFIEGWGVPDQEIAALAEHLNRFLPDFYWHGGETPMAQALTVFLVDIGALTGNQEHAFWNTFGPIQAMDVAHQAGRPALAICRGRISSLPAKRKGVWISTSSSSWESTLRTLVRALAALAWTPCEGYQDIDGWKAVRELTMRHLLAVVISGADTADFGTLLRDATANAIIPPAALVVAGVTSDALRRTLVEAGIQDIPLATTSPMTLDGVQRIDGLIGFEWSFVR
ncbi:hypothetical protein [Achromobacter dolens]|uniref:hypothetical protein n=1 Tax=Achromobacter TaxID=222 RepID=UPI0013C2AF91|nr:hypothetical protein [Achromobacter dolens]